MTVSSSTRKAGPFSCNGVLTSFPFTFKCFSSADVRVVFTSTSAVETDLVLDTDYTISLNADQNASPGGTIETLTAYATGEKITVVSDVDFLQETDIQNQGGFYPEVIENALDKVTMLVQQVKEEVDRSIKVSVSSAVIPEDYLTQAEVAATNASASASAAAASASAADASADAAAVSAGEIVGFEWAGSWLTSTQYYKNNLTSESGNTYIALSDHISGTFSTDFGNGLWEIFASKGAAGAGTGDMLAANNLSEVNPDTARATISAAKTGAVTGSGITQSTSRILGRTTAGTGAIEEISIGAGLILSAGSLSSSVSSTGGLIGYQVFTSSGTYTKGTNNPSYVIVEVLGGGGGGGGASATNYHAGGGGGGGGYSFKKILNAALAASETVTVGAGGTAGANTGGNGGTGGTSSFGTHATATGGGGGGGGGSATNTSLGGAGGIGASGDFNSTGSSGGYSQPSATLSVSVSGVGGSSVKGGGANAIASNGTGNSATSNTGGGGGGAVGASGNGRAGGVGGSGLVIVWEYQ